MEEGSRIVGLMLVVEERNFGRTEEWTKSTLNGVNYNPCVFTLCRKGGKVW